MAKWPGCEQCPLYNAPGPVRGEGPDRPRLIYLGHKPGDDEIVTGHPFTGPTGSVLNRQLFDAGLRRSDLWIGNLVMCQPPNHRDPTNVEIECCNRLLKPKLDSLKCDTVVLAGDMATHNYLDGYSTISSQYDPGAWKRTKGGQWVEGKRAGVGLRMGCIEQMNGRKWIATPHPAAIMRDPEHKFDAIDHLKKAKMASGVPIPRPSIQVEATDSEVRDAVHYVLTESKMFADDVETYSTLPEGEDDYVFTADSEVSMCALAYRPHTAMVLTPRQIPLIAPLYYSDQIWCCEQNGTYDGAFIDRYIPSVDWKAKRFDTMLAAHYHRSYAPKNLKPSILGRYTWLPYYKHDLQRLDMRLYCGMDGVTTYDAAVQLMSILKGEKLWDLFFRIGMPILPELEDWRRTGLNVDLRRALVMKLVTEAKLVEANRRIRNIVGDPLFNWGSDDQMKDLLYGKWKLPPQYNKEGREYKLTTDAEARKRIRWEIEKRKRLPIGWEPAREFLLLVDYASGEEKKLEYFERISSDGRIHPFFKAHGAESLRLSSTPNVQNIPVHDITKWQSHGEAIDNPVVQVGSVSGFGSIRSCIIPDDPSNDWLLTVDYDQIQIWIMAVTFNVKWLLEIFRSGAYLYGVVYEKLFKERFWSPSETVRSKTNKLPSVDKAKLRRAKAVPLGFLFGRSAAAVAEEYGWVVEDAAILRSWWFAQCPELEGAMDSTEYTIAQAGRIRHVHGSLMWYPSGKLTEAINGYAQNPEACIMMETIVRVNGEIRRRGLREKGCRQILSVHDSGTWNLPTPYVVPVYEEIIRPAMERSIPELGDFKFRHSAEVSKRWDWDDETKDHEPMTFEEWKSKYDV